MNRGRPKGLKLSSFSRQKISDGIRTWHSKLSPETRKIISENQSKAGKGRPKTEQWKLNMAIRLKKNGNPMKGKFASKETRDKMSVSQKLKYSTRSNNWGNLSSEQRLTMINRLTKSHTSETYSKISRTKKEFYKTHSNHFKGKTHSKKTREKISKTLQEKVTNGTWIPHFRKVCIEELRKINRNSRLKSCSHPNGLEKQLSVLIELACPGQYKFTGNGKVVINNMYPDFTNCNGKKKVIEAYGDYWHRGQNPQDRINKFKEFGVDCLVIWEHDLSKNLNIELINTITEFNNV